MITKDQLTERRRGGRNGKAQRGTIVRIEDTRKGTPGHRWVLKAGEFEVMDLMQRATYNIVDSVGVVHAHKGGQLGLAAVSIKLSDIVEIVR